MFLKRVFSFAERGRGREIEREREREIEGGGRQVRIGEEESERH